MYAKAQQIGLPAVFVDIRHEATHGDMPSLTSLRSAGQRAMQWLWDDYWKGLSKRESSIQVIKATGQNSNGLVVQGSMGVAGQTESAAEEHLKEQAVLPDAGSQVGGWEKWQGRWDSKPIGMI